MKVREKFREKIKREVERGKQFLLHSHMAAELRFLKPWKSSQETLEEYFRETGKVILAGVVLVVFLVGLSVAFGRDQENSPLIYRDDGVHLARGEPDKENAPIILTGEVTDPHGTVSNREITVIVPGREANKEEAEELFLWAESVLDTLWLGENVSAQEIRKDLNLIGQIPDSSVAVEWDVNGSFLVTESGRILNENVPESGETVQLTAILRLGKEEKVLEKSILVFPPLRAEKTLEELLNAYIEQEAEKQGTDSMQNTIRLPDELEGYRITWKKQGKQGLPVGLLLLGVVILIVVAQRLKLKEDMKRRSRQLMLDYSEIISKLSLFLGAGMSIRMAWGRMVKEYTESIRREEDRRFAYEEMCITWNELCMGTPEEEALERFGRNVGELSYLRFGTLLAQNIRKGGTQLTAMLETEEEQAFSERRENAKQAGEQAATKLLGPMIGMLVIVIAIVVIPAFLNL